MTLPWRRWTRDHRGRWVRLPGTLQLEFELHDDDLNEGVNERIKAHLAATDNTWWSAATGCAWQVTSRLVLYLFVLAAAIGLMSLFSSLGSGGPLIGAAIFSAGLVIVFLLDAFADSQIGGASRQAVIEAFLREDRCPSCGYEIKTTPPESDGCVVCPECGAAWRLALPGQVTDPERPHDTAQTEADQRSPTRGDRGGAAGSAVPGGRDSAGPA